MESETYSRLINYTMNNVTNDKVKGELHDYFDGCSCTDQIFTSSLMHGVGGKPAAGKRRRVSSESQGHVQKYLAERTSDFQLWLRLDTGVL